MGNGACSQQVPSLDEIKLINSKFQSQSDIQSTMPLLNSQSQSPSKPCIECSKPIVQNKEDEEFEIQMTLDDKGSDELSPLKRNNRLSRAQSPTKKQKKKQNYREEELYFLDLLKEDRKNSHRRKSHEKQLSPVKVLHQHRKHHTALLIENREEGSSELIKVKRSSQQLDEAMIFDNKNERVNVERKQSKSILKTIGSEKSISSGRNSSKKRVTFGKVYRQYHK